MDLQLSNFKFRKDTTGVCSALIEINEDNDKNPFYLDFEIDTEKDSQTYYLGSEQLTPELKTAFHAASLIMKQLDSDTSFVFRIPAPDCTPELFVDGLNFYNGLCDLDNFESCMKACLKSINQYLSGDEGETSKIARPNTLAFI